jgi:hypothetical protein
MSLFLTEMSFQRKMAINKISEIAPMFIRHIFILMLFPRAREKNHWLSEIDNFLADIFITYNNIKGKNNFSKKDFYNMLITRPFISSDQHAYIKKIIAYSIKKESELVPIFYHNSLTIGKLDIIFNSIKLLITSVIDLGLRDESISKAEFEQLMKKYIWNMKLDSKN